MKRKYFWLIIIVLVLAGMAAIVFWSGPAKPNYVEKNTERAWWGLATSSLEIVEYSDFACPSCRDAEEMLKFVKNRWSDKVKFSYKHFPLIGNIGHEQSFAAAEAAECANDQKAFWPYHDLLFANQSFFTKAALVRYAVELHLNQTDFSNCLKSRVKSNVVKVDREEAIAKNLEGTPTFFLNGQLVSWPLLPQMIANLLGDKGPIPSFMPTK